MSTRSFSDLFGFSNSAPRPPAPARTDEAAGWDAAAPVDGMPVMPYSWAKSPFLSSPGQTRKYFTLPDECLARYGEQYLSFIGPWKHLVGTELPNFYQFIAWHEQQPVRRSALTRLAA